ncbi:hypothetical protein FB567DRAFT_492308 [Paraphoma chrysanthemicola]|uniref:Zn(2)-C6 fungal-type domain-containing protein n=1 Tax=Paraphoma chrysanthemicola TaxID=798071 RepID=A0A8K0R914_9PLEO|nr:hypothetical protein FB567DRAFT_492308 [Paraphoma chrysanthemicola]
MPLLKGKPRQRAWKPKNRTGCKTCKIRKVKCDEEKPHCKRCTSTGRTCDGYDPNFRPASHSPPPHATSGLSPPSSGRELVRSVSPVPLAPALRLKTAQERDSFEFFTTYAISSLRGFLDSPFWQREILQAAHRYESIQHCIVALGAMHRRFYEGSQSHINEADMSDQYLQFALRQSNQAIQGLLKATGPGTRANSVDKVTLMTCSVLFSSMACLQGHQREGLQHLRSGIRLLNELDEETSSKPESHPIDVDSLRSIFVGLDMQARSIMTSQEAERWEPLPRTKAPAISEDADVDDASLLAMQRYLQSLLNHSLAFLQATVKRPAHERESIYHEYSRLLSRLDRGTLLLDRLSAKAASTTTPTSTTTDYTQPLLALQLLHCQLESMLRSPRFDLGDKFQFMADPFREPFDMTAHYTKMLDLAERLLPHQSSLSPVFTTSMGPLSVLWLVATRAPSSCTALRKRAVRLMLSYPRREGFWDGLVAGQIAQECMHIEQERTQEELGLVMSPTRDLIVPEDLRIVIVALEYDELDNRRAKVTYRSARDMARGEAGRVQYLAW